MDIDPQRPREDDGQWPARLSSGGASPEAWSKIRLSPYTPWSWTDQIWGSEIPGRVKHDIQTIDFLISYRGAIDAELAVITKGRFQAVTEWRCEHAFLAPWEKGDRYREGAQMKLKHACNELFAESTCHDEHIRHGGFTDERLRVVKPDGAISIIIEQVPRHTYCQPMLSDEGIRPETTYGKCFPAPQIVVDVLVEFDRTGKPSANSEKLACLDMFLNVGRHLVKHDPIHCLRHSDEELQRAGENDGYTPNVFVVFVCPPGKLATIMNAADEILTGHLCSIDGSLYSYEGRKRIIFCEANSFGNITADLYDRERWLRQPAHRRPAPPAPRTADKKMWQLPELPPRRAVKTEDHRAPTRENDTLEPVEWESPAMIDYLEGGNAQQYEEEQAGLEWLKHDTPLPH